MDLTKGVLKQSATEEPSLRRKTPSLFNQNNDVDPLCDDERFSKKSILIYITCYWFILIKRKLEKKNQKNYI